MAATLGTRHLAVHDDQALDPEILKAILAKHLSDLEAFWRYALNQLPA